MQASENKKRDFGSSIAMPSSESTHIYGLLKVDWPVAERVMVRLGALITSCTGGQSVGQEILRDIVERSVKAYGKALYGRKNGKCPDRVRIGVFTDCLLQETYQFIRSRHSSPVFCEAQADADSEKELRRSLYELLVCDTLKIVLKEAHFEEAIMDGGPVVCD